MCSAVHNTPPKCACCLALYYSCLILIGTSRGKDGICFISAVLMVGFQKATILQCFSHADPCNLRKRTKIYIFLNLYMRSSKCMFSNRREMRLRSFSSVLEFVYLSHISTADLRITGLWLDQHGFYYCSHKIQN